MNMDVSALRYTDITHFEIVNAVCSKSRSYFDKRKIVRVPSEASQYLILFEDLFFFTRGLLPSTHGTGTTCDQFRATRD